MSAALDRPPADLGEAWDAVLFNSFHDILPGSSIERAFDDQLAWLGVAQHQSQQAELDALDALALRVDTTTPKPEGDHPSAAVLLAWNPHPHPYRGHIEMEANLDYRPIWAYANRAEELPVEIRGPDRQRVPFQLIATEGAAMTNMAWRKRALVPVELPPLGWSVFEMAWVEGAEPPPAPAGPVASMPQPGRIENGLYAVQAATGETSVSILRHGKPIFTGGGLSAITVEDPWGSWGGMAEEPESLDLSTVRAQWRITQVEALEIGPERAALWVRLRGDNSRLDLTFLLSRGRDAVDVRARVFWNERAARLKLVFPLGDQATFEVPGGSVARGPLGEVPGGRWVRVQGPQGDFGFASDALYAFDCKEGALQVTVVRSGRYATDVKAGPEEEPWVPAADAGELRFRFLLAPGDENLPVLARELEEPPVVLLVPAKGGDLPRAGSLASLSPSSLRILALKPAEDGQGWILRLQETAGATTKPQLTWLGANVPLSPMAPYRIATWRLRRTADGWQAQATDVLES